MNAISLIISAKRPQMVALFALLSMLLVAYGPMATYSQAQSTSASNFQTLKTKVLGEIDRRIGNYEKTITALGVNLTSTDNKDDGSISGEGLNGNGDTFKFTVDETGIHGNIYVGTDLKEKVKGLMQKVVDGLKATQKKVQETKKSDQLGAIANNLDAQYIVNQLTQVQATVTQAADSMTDVISNLKQAYNNLQKRVTLLEQCSNKNTQSNSNCAGFKNLNQESIYSLNGQMKNLGSIIATMGSVVTSVVTLNLSLVSQFTTMTSGLGDLGKLGNVTDLSAKIGDTDALNSLTTSFSGILSQLNLVSSMATTAQAGIQSISEEINA